jgi:hypothetical protein
MRLFVWVCILICSFPLPAAETARPIVSIIIDDMGYRLEQDQYALTLSGPVAFSILPYFCTHASSQPGSRTRHHCGEQSSRIKLDRRLPAYALVDAGTFLSSWYGIY